MREEEIFPKKKKTIIVRDNSGQISLATGLPGSKCHIQHFGMYMAIVIVV
jgi:hypothetical protein